MVKNIFWIDLFNNNWPEGNGNVDHFWATVVVVVSPQPVDNANSRYS